MQQFIQWLGNKLFSDTREAEPESRAPGVRVRPRPAPRAAAQSPRPPGPAVGADVGSHIEDGGPGKNVLVRSKYIREDSGTHEILKIVDESLVDDEPGDGGIDPYNTGRFDRSKNWNYQYRK